MPSHGNYLHPSLEWTPSIWRPLLDRGVDVVSFQTRKGATADLLRDCRDRGIATVFSISDMHLHEVPKEVLALTDTLVVSSEFLAAPARKIHPRVEIVDDPIETPTGTTREGTDRGKSPELIWLGHPGHWKHVAFLYEVLDCKELEGVTLKTISHHPEATVQWTPEGVWEQARHSDIAVIPCDLDERGQAKSSNRLVCFMAMGYPVVCTPIPAYREHIRHGENGYFAVTIEEWRDALQPLLDPTHRETIGERAAKTPTLDSLRLERIAQRWETIFDQSRTTKEKPTPGAISAGAESVRNDSLPS